MAGRDERRLAFLLNSCKSGNILDSATSEITDFIQDYFLSDKFDEEDHGSDSDDEVLGELQPAQDLSECENANTDDDEDEILEEPVVRIDRVAEHCVEDMDCFFLFVVVILIIILENYCFKDCYVHLI